MGRKASASAQSLSQWSHTGVHDIRCTQHRVGIMDPLCGGTRAARYTAQGDLAQAWRYNPLGIVAVLGAVLVVARTTIGVTARRWENLDLRLTRRARHLWLAVLFVLIALLEVRQQMRAELLMEGTFVPWA